MVSILSTPRAAWITLAGPDARDFLHRLTTVHVRALQPGQGAPGFFLTAQGKIRAAFTLWNYGPQDFAFELDPGGSGQFKKELLEAIEQFHFGEKLEVADVTDGALRLECRWILGTEVTELEGTRAFETLAVEDEIRICHHGERDFGRPWVSAWGRPGRIAQWIERAFPSAREVSDAQLESWRIEQARPRVGSEITAETIPLEVGLREGVADDKGCYPGQEVIERIISLGSPARRLARVSGSGEPPAPGEALLNLAEPAAEIGTITSVARGDAGFQALAFVRKIHAKEGLEVKLRNGSLARIDRIAPYA